MAPVEAASLPPPVNAASAGAAFTIEDAEAELASLAAQEQDLEFELDKLYGRASQLCQSECRNLAHAGDQHKQVPAAIRRLQETLQQTSGVADELSSRVRKLDDVCGRVNEALKLVDDMLELRNCSDQVMKAISSEDYETAAKCVARFRASHEALPPGTDDNSVRVLKDAGQQLSAIVRKHFEEAMAKGDTAGVSRFAKLFHPLGLAGEGVQKYTEFIRRSLCDTCAAEFRALAPSFKRTGDEPMPYAEALTKVAVAIADIVQDHQQSVEEEFGPANFVVVIRGLLEEADIQGIKVIDKFSKDNAKVFDNAQKVDTRDCGVVLEECALITQRAQQFNTYIHGVAQGVVEMISEDEMEGFVASLPPGASEVDGLVEVSKLLKRVQELVSNYVMVEQAYLMRSVELAVASTDSLDGTDPDQLTTTMVDDAFFILQTSMQRAITTCEINAVCAVVNNVNMAVGEVIKPALTNNLSESKRLYDGWVRKPSNLAPPPPGEHPLAELFLDPERKGERAMFKNLTAAHSWPHSLNNLQQCVEYVDKLKESTEAAFSEYFPSEGVDRDRHVVFEQVVSQLDTTKTELENLHVAKCKEGMAMMRVHLSPMMLPLEQLDYEINETKYSEYQVIDPFAKAFNAQAEAIHTHLKLVLNQVSCEEIMQHMAELTCRRIEKEALSKKFTLFGALQFESDVRALCSFFTAASEQTLRHKFARVFEMANLLILETPAELRELYGDQRTWRLSKDEIRKLIASRVDFEVSEADLEAVLPL